MWLRQSTASQEISLGQFLDSTDGNTEENGLTIANTDIKLRKGGTTTLANKNSGGATSISNGVYHATLDATDTNTLGLLEVYVHVAGALATKSNYMILPAATYDALVTNGLNDIAATDVVSAGAITTLSGAIVNVDLVDTLTTYTGNTPQTADHTAGIADIPTVAEFNARTLPSASYFDFTTDSVIVGTNNDKTGYSISGALTTLDALNNFNPTTDAVATVTTVTNMRGTDNALLAASYTAPDNASITSILADTNELQTNQGNWLTATGFSTLVATDIVTGGAITTVSGDASVDINKINGVTITGDGSSNPFDV